jgi:Lrp/AsnC family transcriptional regulator, leucine-responsive regulatory protein
MLDPTDRIILQLLQENARLPNAEIARRLEMAPSAVLERIRKLESRRVITGYEACIEPGALGLGLAAFVFVRADEPLASGEVGASLASMPEVLEVHHIAGEDCYLIKVRTFDTESLGRFLRERLGTLPSVRSTRTTVVLSSIKESARLPIPNSERAEGSEVPRG